MKVPKYQLVQNELRQQIISGKFENGDKFYTEAELTKLYNVSSITVIRAMNELVKDGYLIRQQGKGTFVSRSRKGKLVKFSDIEIFSTDEDSVVVLGCEKGNDQRILKKLQLDKKISTIKLPAFDSLRMSPTSTTSPTSQPATSSSQMLPSSIFSPSTSASSWTLTSTCQKNPSLKPMKSASQLQNPWRNSCS